jgi:ketosteroid isomerase-like protein
VTTTAGFLRALVASAVLAFAFAAAAQGDTPAQAAIRAALTQWMADFNAGKADKVCDLFATDLVAQYRGQPERDYATLCDLLKRSLADGSRSYRYALAIKEILVEGDLAVVRLTWTLSVRGKDAAGETTAEEPGMDVFRRQSDGTWKISRYLAYESP